MNFTVVMANIADISADAIVLPANESLKEGPGASEAIFKKAGRAELTKVCAQIKHCKTGSAVPTPAFDLDAKYIIHAVVPKWWDGKHNEYGLLSSAYLTSLKLADIMGCTSIAFPLLASGNNGFDRELAFQIAEKSIENFSGDNIENIILVVYGENTRYFVHSKGYDVTVMTEIRHRKTKTVGMEKAVKSGLRACENWIKNEENIRILFHAGFGIAEVVLSGNKKAGKIVDIMKKLI